MNPANTAFVLFSAALVMLMIPGLALFYAGMVRVKNVLGTLMQNFVLLGLIGVQWALFGYSLAFGPDVGGIIGSLSWVGLNGVGVEPFKAVFGNHSPHGVYDFSSHVCHHHPCADHRGLGGAPEVQFLSGVHAPVGHVGL